MMLLKCGAVTDLFSAQNTTTQVFSSHSVRRKGPAYVFDTMMAAGLG